MLRFNTAVLAGDLLSRARPLLLLRSITAACFSSLSSAYSSLTWLSSIINNFSSLSAFSWLISIAHHDQFSVISSLSHAVPAVLFMTTWIIPTMIEI